MAQKNPTPGNNTGLPGYSDSAAKERFIQVAEWLALPPPPISYDDGSILLDDALYAWCMTGGVSFDWVFCGNAKIMAISYQREQEREKPFRDAISGLDEVEQRMLLEVMQAQRDADSDFNEALVAFTTKVEEHRARPQ